MQRISSELLALHLRQVGRNVISGNMFGHRFVFGLNHPEDVLLELSCEAFSILEQHQSSLSKASKHA
jgi:hypothetical protein